jgi:hypothetical protein
MALPTVVAGGLRPALMITWRLDDGTALDLTGATLSGTITTRAGVTRAIEGVLSVTDPINGWFSWAVTAADVVEGRYKVQLTATFPTGPSPAKTFETDWVVV